MRGPAKLAAKYEWKATNILDICSEKSDPETTRSPKISSFFPRNSCISANNGCLSPAPAPLIPPVVFTHLFLTPFWLLAPAWRSAFRPLSTLARSRRPLTPGPALRWPKSGPTTAHPGGNTHSRRRRQRPSQKQQLWFSGDSSTKISGRKKGSHTGK